MEEKKIEIPKQKNQHVQRTLIFIKPEAIQRHLIGEFFSKFEKRGMKLVACKLIAPTREQIGKHYPDDESWYADTGTKTLKSYAEKGIDTGLTAVEMGKKIRQKLVNYFADRPLVATVWEGTHAVALGRKTAGSTNPLMADIGSIRGDYSMESYDLADELDRPVHTLIHASGSPEEAEREIKLWFKPEEILDYDLIIEDLFYAFDWGRVKK